MRTPRWWRRRKRGLRGQRDEISVGTRTPLVVPFQVNSTSFDQSIAFSRRSGHNRRAGWWVELQLLGNVRHPAFAKRFPGQRGDGASAQHRPHRHFESARVRTGHNADAVRFGQLKNFAHQIDAISQTRLADLGAVRTAQRFGSQLVEEKTGGLAQGPTRRTDAQACAPEQ
jgi:hypothetical protein